MLCDGRSTWSVIKVNCNCTYWKRIHEAIECLKDHPDFEDFDDANPTNRTETQFNILRPESGSFVFVLDVSGSMDDGQGGPDRLSRVRQAVKKWIQYDVNDGVDVGIVSFA